MPAIGEARVIAIGETTHYSHELYALRDRLARFLIERAGVTALAWESGFSEAARADEWVRGGPGDVGEVLASGFTSSFGRCEEMRAQLEWLRAHNAGRSRPVRIYGVDLPGSLGSLLPALDIVASSIGPHDRGCSERLARIGELARAYGDPVPPTDAASRGSWRRYAAMPRSERDALTAALADLVARLAALRPQLIGRAGEAEFEQARWNLHLAARLDAYLRDWLASGERTMVDANVRDLAMAETVEWMLESEPRVLVFAHNVHIQRTPFALPWLSPDGAPAPVDSMGGHLAAALGSDYLTIGTTVGGGEALTIETDDASADGIRERVVPLRPVGEETLDGLFHGLRSGPGLIDLRRLAGAAAERVDGAHLMRCLDHLVEVPARRAFDLLAHVPAVSLWHSTATEELIGR